MKTFLIMMMSTLLTYSDSSYLVQKVDTQHWKSVGVGIVWLERNDSIFKTMYFKADSMMDHHPNPGDQISVDIWPWLDLGIIQNTDVESVKWHPGSELDRNRCLIISDGKVVCPDHDTTELYIIYNPKYYKRGY